MTKKELRAKITAIYNAGGNYNIIWMVKFHRELFKSTLADAADAVRVAKDGVISFLPLETILKNFGANEGARTRKPTPAYVKAICFAAKNYKKLGFSNPFSAVASIEGNFTNFGA